MKYDRLSHKQLTSMLWWQMPQYKDLEGIIGDGSIRSGKTLSMSDGFILWSMASFNGQAFALCGKTIESLRRNVIIPMTTNWLEGLFIVKEHRSQNYIEVMQGNRSNRYYLFGGRDESSASLIQGITLAGVLFDEVALMPRSFVEQALARCSIQSSKFWFNCNPEHPEHWFNKEWVCKSQEKKVLHLHFTMEDNYSLTDTIKSRYESLYTGVFYDRYIRGLWCVAEGLVYPNFCVGKNTTDIIPAYGEYYISVDYGTLNPFSAGLWCVDGQKATRLAEYYHDGRAKKELRTDEEYYQELEKLAGDRPIRFIVVDPSAASFIECIKRHGKYIARKASNEVIDGIRVTANMLNSDKIQIHNSCTDSIREFGLYRWDEKNTVDKVLKENDHAMDDIRYFCNTILRREFGWDW